MSGGNDEYKESMESIGDIFTDIAGVVEAQAAMHQQLIDDEDEDADPEDLEIWTTRLKELKELLGSDNWHDEIG